ncbi:MAG: CAP domain-containing protein [bacterium]
MKNSHKKQNTSTKNSLPIKISKITLSFALTLLIFSATLTAFASPITEENVLKNINDQRIINNLKPLKIDQDLNRAATLKSKDMINRDYFDHYAFGLSPWVFIRNAGYDYDEAGENLAMDFVTSEGMVNAWMNSPKHRDNILNADYQDIGVGIVKGEFTQGESTHTTYMVTNMFGTRKTDISQIFTNVISRFTRFFGF